MMMAHSLCVPTCVSKFKGATASRLTIRDFSGFLNLRERTGFVFAIDPENITRRRIDAEARFRKNRGSLRRSKHSHASTDVG